MGQQITDWVQTRRLIFAMEDKGIRIVPEERQKVVHRLFRSDMAHGISDGGQRLRSRDS